MALKEDNKKVIGPRRLYLDVEEVILRWTLVLPEGLRGSPYDCKLEENLIPLHQSIDLLASVKKGAKESVHCRGGTRCEREKKS